MRRAAKRDVSEPEIVAALVDMGFSVYRLDRPADLLVGFRRRTFLVECKYGTKGYGAALNKNQSIFQDTWRGSAIVILRTAQDAIVWGKQVASEAA